MPGSSQRYLDKSRTLTADLVAYDLEDSVTPANKANARNLVRTALDSPKPSTIGERAVRINSVGSGLALADLEEVLKSPNLTTLVLPKTDSPSDLTFVTDVISHTRPKDAAPVSVLALIESARSLQDLGAITKAAPNILSGLIFAAEDFALDLSLTRTPSLSEFLFARSAIVTAARAANLLSTIDLVSTAFKSEADQEALLEESRNGKRMGFNGKQCIHPGQVSTVQKIFSPEEAEVEWAVKVVIAQRKAEERGRRAWALEGKMIDRPVEGKANAVVEKAKRCGLDVEALMVKFKGQEPE